MTKYLVSACLLGCKCKYDGASNHNPGVERFLRAETYYAICPEVDGGLPVPRPASEINREDGAGVLAGRAQVKTQAGDDVSAYFSAGSRIAVERALHTGASIALLKERSPSCGVSQIYNGHFDGGLRPGRGVAAAALAAAGIALYSEENIPWGGKQMDYSQATETIIDWLKHKVREAGAEGCVVGLSGGIDSAVVAALVKQAFPDKALAVIMPIFSSNEDVEHAWQVAKSLGIESIELNMDTVYDNLVSVLAPDAGQLPPENLALANIKPRLRMTALYFLAARRNYLVAGTGNKSELITGFFTKYGDGGVDLEPIGALVKSQVRELAKYLGIPEQIIDKPPSAGLWPGQTDEGELGIRYSQLDEYILTGSTDSLAQTKIEALIKRVKHKLEPPPVCPL